MMRKPCSKGSEETAERGNQTAHHCCQSRWLAPVDDNEENVENVENVEIFDISEPAEGDCDGGEDERDWGG